MDYKTICIAGKNNIAIDVTKKILQDYPNINIVACCNKNDNGINNFQKSFKAFCELNNIEIISLEKAYQIKDMVFLSLEFDQIIKTELFKCAEFYNMHFSFLPEYKGMFTSALPILHGKKYSGVTLHKIDKGIDTGEIIHRIKIEIDNSTTSEDLYAKYILEGTKLVCNNLSFIITNSITSLPQDSDNASYFSKKSIDYKNLVIDLNKTAFEIQRQVNAFMFPFYQVPVIHGESIYKVEVLSEPSDLKYGTIINKNDFFLDICTIDYNVRLYKYKLEELLSIAREGDIEMLNNFISYKYNIFQRSKEGWDIAIVAAYNGQFEFLDYLFAKYNWDNNTCNYNGTTLMMYLMTYASKTNNISYFKSFLEKNKINLRIKDFKEKDIFEYSKIYNNSTVIDLLEKFKNND